MFDDIAYSELQKLAKYRKKRKMRFLRIFGVYKIPKPVQCYFAEIVDISEKQMRLYNSVKRLEILVPPVYKIRHLDDSVISVEHTDWGQDLTGYTDFIGYGERYKIGEKVIFFEEPGIGRCIVPRENE